MKSALAAKCPRAVLKLKQSFQTVYSDLRISLTHENIAGLFDVLQSQVVWSKQTSDSVALRYTSVKSINIFAAEKSSGDKAGPWEAWSLSVRSWVKNDKEKSFYQRKPNFTCLETVVFGSQLVIRVVSLFTNVVVTGVKNVQKTWTNNESVLNNVSIVITACTRSSGGVSWETRTIKLLEVVTNIIVQKLIARCACCNDGRSNSCGTCESSGTKQLNLLVCCQRNNSVTPCWIEELRSSRFNQKGLRISYVGTNNNLIISSFSVLFGYVSSHLSLRSH